MPPLPRWLTISYGPSRVPGNRVIGGGDYSRAGVRADRFVGEWHTMTADEAVEFVATHGVVLESASGPVPSLVAVAVGAPVRGSWWGHPQSHQIFKLTRAVRASPSVLVCRLVGGKVTLVHRRLWPAVVRVSDRFPADHVAKIVEVHTDVGYHRVEETPFPDWVPPPVLTDAAAWSEEEALEALGSWVPHR